MFSVYGVACGCVPQLLARSTAVLQIGIVLSMGVLNIYHKNSQQTLKRPCVHSGRRRGAASGGRGNERGVFSVVYF